MKKGFTLLELLLVVGTLGILMAVLVSVINPGRLFASARDTQRRSDLHSIINAVYQYVTENGGLIPADIIQTPTNLGTDIGLVDLTQELVPKFITQIPEDPSTGTSANTGYTISKNGNGRIVMQAVSEITPSIPIQIIK